MKRLIIIDGNALLHRAFHALPPLTNPQGQVINAVYGFTSITLKLFTDFRPQFMAVAFDRAAPTFRKKLYTDYQINRPKMDDELVPQVDTVHNLVDSLGLPVYEMDGWEADDIIGTIARRANTPAVKPEDKLDQIIIVTGDRDIFQLVNENVFVYMPTKGISQAKLYSEKEVEERMGVPPKLIPDYKALAGDASDNYPGVAGIGPKTAVNLLRTYHSLEGIYEALENDKVAGMSANTLTKLTAGKKDALLSYDLATIRCDVPIEVNLPVIASLDNENSRRMFIDLGFRTLYQRLTGEANPNSSAGIKPPKNKPVKKEKSEKDNSQQSLF